MNFVGFKKFIEKVPYLSGWKAIFIPIYAILIVKGALIFLTFCYSLPEKLSHFPTIFLAMIPLLAVFLIELLGFALVYQMWGNRTRLIKTYGKKSYRRIIPVGLAGVVLVLSLCINMYNPFYLHSQIFWSTSQFNIIATPLFSLAGELAKPLFIAKNILSSILLFFGLSIVFRSLATFGFDYMAVVYLYFPEESNLQNHKIYSVLRHPTYTAVILINLGGMFYTNTLLSVLFSLLFLLGLWMHIRLVEEKELIERFGESYITYRRKVPAFFVMPKNWGIFIRFVYGAS